MLRKYDRVSGTIRGTEAVVAALLELKKRAARDGIRRAMWWLAREIRRDYEAVIPVDTGLARRSLGSGVYRKGSLTVAWIGPRAVSGTTRQGKRPYDYLHFPDLGTRYIRWQHFAGRAARSGSTRVKPLLDTMIWDAIRKARNAGAKTP